MREQSLLHRPPTTRAAWHGLNRADLQLLGIWLCMRLGTSLWAAVVSSLRPLTLPEQVTAVWPPSAPLGAWLDRILLAPWNRWDVEYYLKIAARGYRADDGTAQFHPLLPWLATPLAWFSGHPLLSLILVSSAAGALLLLAFERLALLDLPPDAARSATLLLLAWPPAFVLFAPYTEGLWLLCGVLCLLWARQRRWWLAGLAGGLAALTRQQGILLLLPLAWELWEEAGRNWRRAVANWRHWLAPGLVPAGLLVWLVYRAVVLNDLRANLDSPHALIYSLLISPSANRVVPVQAFLWPWQALWRALQTLWTTPSLDVAIDVALGAAFIGLTVLAWRSMRVSYRIYCLAILVASFGYHTGPVYPYMGLPRHLLLAFPVFIGLGALGQRPRLRLWLVATGLMGMIFLLFLYVLHGWVP